MTITEAVAKAQLILPEHKKEFSALLEKFPDDIQNWLYGPLDDPESLYQGDILIDMPVCFIDVDGDTVKGSDSIAMISNSCDMQLGRKETVIASPIIKIAEFEAHLQKIDDKGNESKLQDIRNNNIFSYFYLPPTDSFSESFVDFSKMITINSDYVNKAFTENRLISLSRNGFYLFLIKLTFHLARMEYAVGQN